jgi:class 3 adenylate cyclase
VVIGEQTRASVGDEFALEPLGAFSLKGKEKEVLAFEVRSAAASDPDTIPRGGPEAPGGASDP